MIVMPGVKVIAAVTSRTLLFVTSLHGGSRMYLEYVTWISEDLFQGDKFPDNV